MNYLLRIVFFYLLDATSTKLKSLSDIVPARNLNPHTVVRSASTDECTAQIMILCGRGGERESECAVFGLVYLCLSNSPCYLSRLPTLLLFDRYIVCVFRFLL